MSNLRPSGPFLVGLVTLLVPLVISEPVGRAFDACGGDYGCAGVIFVAGAPAGVIAALVVRRWWDVLELVVGMWLGAAAYATVVAALGSEADLPSALGSILVSVPFGAMVFAGFLGLPLFAIVAVVRWVVRRAEGARPPGDEAELAKPVVLNSRGGTGPDAG
jgi:hypothetical protein